MKAYCLIRPQPHYRREAFVAGLKRAGYALADAPPPKPSAGDLLLIWNRYGEGEALADRFEKHGAQVIVAENGYLGLDADGIQYYALSLGQHNGAGRWPIGDGSRWEKLGIELKPWRTQGQHIVVRGQRGIGSRLMASPPDWHKGIPAKLRPYTGRAVKVLEHPGKPACHPDVVKWLCDNYRGAHACVIWSSGAGIRALIEGVPVIYQAPHWICEAAAAHDLSAIEKLDGWMNDALRLRALREMAWAQWTIAEIASGEPFVRLRELYSPSQGAAA